MKKKLLSVLLVVAMLCAMLPGFSAAAATTKTFVDVDNDAWYATQVYALAEAGVMSGTDSTHFSPSGTVSRAQFVTALAYAAATSAEVDSYKNTQAFDDVPTGKWYSGPIAWCAEHNVASGTTETTFDPDRNVTRQEAAVFLVNFAANVESVTMTDKNAETAFSDDSSIAGWASDEVYACQRAGVLSGSNGKFRPTDTMVRNEMASTLLRLLGIEPLDKSELPQPPAPDPSFKEPTVYSQSGATVVEFNPQNGYQSNAVLAQDKLFTTESTSSIVNRTGAYIAVNGAFYASYSGQNMETYATVIKNGQVQRLENPYSTEANPRTPKPAFVVDSNGKASIEYFTTQQTAVLTRGGEEVKSWPDVGCNVDVADTGSTPMMYTRTYGTSVPGQVLVAVTVDGSGNVTKVVNNASNVAIPEGGYVLFQRQRRSQWDDFLDGVQVGDQMSISVKYEGSSTQDIVTAISCGPTLVKDSKAYGDANTYKQEGYTEAKIVSESGARMAIGVKADGTVVIAQTTATLQQMSNLMVSLGCKSAMNLDGGASCSLYVKGKGYIVPQGRNMSNMLVFTQK